MKTNFKIGIFLFILTIFAACKSDDMIYKDANVSAVNALYEPINNKTVKLLSSASASLYFNWEAVKVEDSGAALYEVIFDKAGGDFSKPIYRTTSDNNGYSNGATVTHKIMNKIASLAGIQPGGTGNLIWTVASSRGIKTVMANERRTISVTSLNGFVDIPDEVFITGEGSEGGSTLSAALPFKLNAPGEFEIYTKLEAGKTYYFVDRKTGTPRVFYSTDNATLREAAQTGTITPSKTAVYRINLDFTTATLSYTEIKSVGLWFSPSNAITLNMPYQGKGVWTGTGIVNFKTESWGKDQRYKFQIVTAVGGSDVVKQFGTLNGTDSAPNDASAPSYYFVKLLANVTQWDDKWKFADKVDGKSSSISLVLKGDAAYTHTIVVN
ncbi:SusE domain-containing protein [Pedobacter frigidisoli]|uniref:SusE domain-containing protein n=1 Tax=Pedobacter frigidisoli TaxID=2530455 RepID=UPI00292D8142|nr:SusE domain-containing protein [Pedobacter frigidisoli]